MQTLQAGGRWIKASRNFLRAAAGWAALACLLGWTRLDAAGRAFLASRDGLIALWNLRVRDFACAQAGATASVHGRALTASVPRRRRSERHWLLGNSVSLRRS